jgi:transcriptional regulator with XRE-family HTH domain
MADAAYIRERAREMRTERRFTLDQIAERLALPRTTIYYWIKDLPVPNEVTRSDKREAARRRGSRAMQRKYRMLREVAYREGVENFDELAQDPTFRDFVALYIAEGSKRNRNRVAICNSDPAVLELATRGIRRSTTKPPVFSIQYHADQDLDDLCRF